MKMRLTGAAILAALTTLVGTTTASAQNQSGLVNVAVVGNTVQVPIGIAANVCDVSVNILAQATQTAPADCTAVSGATAFAGPNGGGSNTNQRGLINIAVTDNTIQVPVGIAANICDVAANVLAQEISTGGANCAATGNAGATG